MAATIRPRESKTNDGNIRPRLEQLAQSHSPNQSVSDLVHDAWLRAWQKLDQFQGAQDEAHALAMFRAWLAQIAG